MNRRLLVTYGWLIEAAALLAVIAGGLALLGIPANSLPVHPFGLAVLLVALQHGTMRAAAIAIAATVLLVPSLPAQEFGQDWNAHMLNLAHTPLTWCAVALIIGGFTDRQRRRRDAAEASATGAQEQLGRLLEANEALQASNRALEASVAAQMTTASRIFDATQALRQDEAAVISGTLNLLKATTGATASALYLVDGGRLVLVAAEGETPGRPRELGSAIIAALASGHECLIASRAEDRRILAGQALLAAPLLSGEGAMLGILVIEALPFRDFGLDTVANFVAVCGWVADALAQERALASAEDARFGGQGCRFIGPGSAEAAASFMVSIAQRFQLDLTSIDIGLSPDRVGDVPLLIAEMEGVFRTSDMLLQARRDGTALHALLLGTDMAGGWLAEARLREALTKYDPSLAASIGTNVSCLHQPQRLAA